MPRKEQSEQARTISLLVGAAWIQTFHYICGTKPHLMPKWHSTSFKDPASIPNSQPMNKSMAATISTAIPLHHPECGVSPMNNLLAARLGHHMHWMDGASARQWNPIAVIVSAFPKPEEHRQQTQSPGHHTNSRCQSQPQWISSTKACKI